MQRLNPFKLIVFLIISLGLTMVVATAVGAVTIPFMDVVKVIISKFSFLRDDATQVETIILEIRFPRVLLAAIVGAILAVSGTVMQGLFRNPLADPSLIGVTAGSTMGASIVIVLAAGYSTQWIGLPLVSLGAFAGGITAVWVVYRLANNTYSTSGTSVATMLLAGIGITALAGSVTSLLEFYSDNEMLRRISLWKMGGLDGADYTRVLFAAVVGVLLFIFLPKCSQALNALLLGESEAKHLGINTEKLKRKVIVLVAIGVGVCVALTGSIGFIGLVVPHILRLMIGPDHRFLIPASAIGGALLLVVADALSRTLLAPTEMPVGMLTALIGVPFFISLLRRRYVYGLN
ncbi:MAG: FecCD family ABC transporter permease [Cellvibrionaceae bacterium]